MRRPSALRRLLVALIGLALVLPSALPHPAAAQTAALPAALAVICTTSADEARDGSGPAAWHDPCDHCVGACHGMAGTLAQAALPRAAMPWSPDYGTAATMAVAAAAPDTGHAPRAPPAA